MQCKKCGIDLTGKDCKMVAEWPFCPDCFEQLLAQPAEGPEPESDPGEKTDVLEPKERSEIRRCQLCDREIKDDRFKKVGIWVFCPDCHLDLTPRPRPPARPEPEEKDTAADEDPSDRDRMRLKYVQRVNCTGCGKSIPVGGSQTVEDEPYCPECWYALPEEIRQPSDPEQAEPFESQAPQPSEIPDPDAAPGCESCGRKLPQESLKTVEGYAICQACLSADAELAVHIARGRHQKRMRRIKEAQDL